MRLAPWLLSIVELIFTAGAMFLILVRRSGRNADQLKRVQQAFLRIARRPVVSVLAIGLLTLLIRIALMPILGVPEPGAHDEYSYLLAADTFASLRVTNPPHPLWKHFESFHIIQQPTYMSMYPPAQGLVLAAGQLLGSAWIGELLVTAVMCGAIGWMLQAYVPPAWAFLGGLLAVLRLGILSYWMNGYWSTSIVALGGALVLGAYPRFKKRFRTRNALVMASGAILLAESRPYEGFLLCVPIAVAMLIRLCQAKDKKRALVHVLLPIALMFVTAALAVGYYQFRVTGSPFVLPYEINRGTYSMARYFVWQSPAPDPGYNHSEIRKLYERELRDFQENRTLRGFLARTADKCATSWRALLGPALTLPFIALPWVFRDRKMRFPLVIAAIFLLGLSVETWVLPHYLAPATGLMFLLVIQSLRHLRVWRWRGSPVGLAMVRAVPMVLVAMIIFRLTAILLHLPVEPAWPRGNLHRARVLNRLESTTALHLVIVRYGDQHVLDDEYVYNRADIDKAKVVWARDMGPAGNQELMRYFSNRKMWLLQPDSSPEHLEPVEPLP